MNIYSGGLHDDLQLFPEWDLAVTYFHHNFDEVVNSEAIVPVVIRYIPKYPHPLPTICTPCIVKVAKKNPYWLRSNHCFISFSELSVQKSSYSHKHAVILFNTRTLAQLVVILLIATLSQGLYYSGYIYTHSTAFRSINISTQLYWVSSPLTHSHARPYNQCVNDPCNTNGPTTAGDLLEHFNPGH